MSKTLETVDSELLDPERLGAWMDDEGIASGPIEHAHLLAGGTQNAIVLFNRGASRFVLRRPSLHPRSGADQTMLREATVLRALAQTDVPHPGLVASCSDPAVIGAAFYLMEPVDGFFAPGGLPQLHAASPAVRHAMGLALAEGAARLGAIDHVAVGLDKFGKAQGFLERQAGRWAGQLEGYSANAGWPGPKALGDVESLRRWLESNLPRSSFRPGIMHGDYHIANVLYCRDGPQLAAIVDWELATIGDPLLDLGWILATWPERGGHVPDPIIAVRPWDGFPDASELIAHYGAHSSRDLSSVQWYAVLACYKLGIILEGTYARACSGKASAEVGARLHASAIRLFERAHRWIRF